MPPTPPHPESDELPDDLLDRFVADECTPVEADAVRRWIAADPSPPSRQEKVARVRALWEATRHAAEAPLDSWDVDAAWRRAAQRMGVPSGVKSSARILKLDARPPAARSRTLRVPIPVLRAAAVLLVVGTAALAVYARGLFVDRTNVIAGDVTVPVKEYATVRGQRATIQLVDGSRVILGPASRLLVPADYGRVPGDTQPFTSQSGAGPRVVTLEGEGYFDVAHDAAREFSVRTTAGVVRDIGTKFVVRAHTGSRKTSMDVAVTEGAVLVANTRLNRGDVARLDATTGSPVRVSRGADLRPYTSWIEGRLVFHNTPLAEALPTLERWYDLDITVADTALYGRKLFATVTDGDAASKVLDLVALSLDLRAERVGRKIILHAREK